MEGLLKSEIDKLLQARQARNKSIGAFPQVSIKGFSVQDPTFDLVDAKKFDTPVVPKGSGTVTYVNSNGYDLHFVDYDFYLSAFDSSRYSRNLGRCDYVAFDVDGRCDYFILDELCEGALQNKKQEGINQLAVTLQFLRGSTSLTTAMDSYKNRVCYLSVKERLIASPQGMADAFNNPLQIIPPIYTLNDRRIGNCGFDAYAACRIVLDGNTVNAQPLPKRKQNL